MARYLVAAIKRNRDLGSCAFRISIIHEFVGLAKRAAIFELNRINIVPTLLRLKKLGTALISNFPAVPYPKRWGLYIFSEVPAVVLASRYYRDGV